MLNPEQKRAVEHGEGPMLVVAGPGSGKTRTATSRCAALIKLGVPAERILLVTFTNKAADEMRSRMSILVGADKVRRLWSGTFHSICARILRRVVSKPYLADRKRNFSVYDEEDQKAVIKVAINELEYDPKRIKPAYVQQWISQHKGHARTPDDVDPNGPADEEMRAVWRRYEDSLIVSNAFDFEDLLIRVMVAAESSTEDGRHLRSLWSHVVVDEYQDTDPVQHRLVKAWASSGNVFAVGDPRQAIYGFRGADYSNILKFPTHFDGTEVVSLDQCYRSTPQIVSFCNAVIEGNDLVDNPELPLQINHRMRTENDEGHAVRIQGFGDEHAEGLAVVGRIKRLRRQGVQLGQMAIIYRLHSQSRPFEERLRQAGIPYVLVGGTGFYDRREVRDVLAHCRLVCNGDSAADLRRAVQRPSKGLGPKAVQEFEDIGRRYGSVWDGLVRATGESNRLTARQRTAVSKFISMIRSLRDMSAGKTTRPSEVVADLIERSGLRRYLQAELDKAAKKGRQEIEQAESRLLNLDQIVSSVQGYEQRHKDPSLSGWLEEVALMTQQDNMDDGKADKVYLLTVHAAKGLEFDHVMFVGVETDLMPFYRAVEEGQTDEEQRLCYVASSRARRSLSISYCMARTMNGQYRQHGPSPFVLQATSVIEDPSVAQWIEQNDPLG